MATIVQGAKISSRKRYWNVVSNGLLLFGIRNRLAKIGFDFRPYYWVQEEVIPCNEPKIKGGASAYKVRYLKLDELETIAVNLPEQLAAEVVDSFKKGQLCIGLEHNNEIAAYTFVEINDFVFNKKSYKLKSNEAYLLNMWTFHEHRGKNLAPYLRYQAYQLLKEQGRDVKYSITEYFNKSSIKFKAKLNSEHQKLVLSIILFKKFYWNFLLKEYK
jgi:hypothetical protein